MRRNTLQAAALVAVTVAAMVGATGSTTTYAQSSLTSIRLKNGPGGDALNMTWARSGNGHHYEYATYGPWKNNSHSTWRIESAGFVTGRWPFKNSYWDYQYLGDPVYRFQANRRNGYLGELGGSVMVRRDAKPNTLWVAARTDRLVNVERSNYRNTPQVLSVNPSSWSKQSAAFLAAPGAYGLWQRWWYTP